MVWLEDWIKKEVTPKIREQARKLSLIRNGPKDGATQQSGRNHWQGGLGEYEVADWWDDPNVKVDEDSYGKEGDEGFDFDIPGVGTVDVKTPEYHKGDPLLKVSPEKIEEGKADYYLLATVDLQNYTLETVPKVALIGIASREDILENTKPKMIGGVLSHVTSIHDPWLKPLKEFKANVQNYGKEK